MPEYVPGPVPLGIWLDAVRFHVPSTGRAYLQLSFQYSCPHLIGPDLSELIPLPRPTGPNPCFQAFIGGQTDCWFLTGVDTEGTIPKVTVTPIITEIPSSFPNSTIILQGINQTNHVFNTSPALISAGPTPNVSYRTGNKFGVWDWVAGPPVSSKLLKGNPYSYFTWRKNLSSNWILHGDNCWTGQVLSATTGNHCGDLTIGSACYACPTYNGAWEYAKIKVDFTHSKVIVKNTQTLATTTYLPVGTFCQNALSPTNPFPNSDTSTFDDFRGNNFNGPFFCLYAV